MNYLVKNDEENRCTIIALIKWFLLALIFRAISYFIPKATIYFTFDSDMDLSEIDLN